MTARLLIGDVFDRMAELPDGSVDLVLTSPPFLALRSYLPADHPDKAKEIGSEATPAAFIDTLLRLTGEWRRLLAPHGSIAVELGDTYSGSGGAGGDYGPDGLREGQPKFRQGTPRWDGRPAGQVRTTTSDPVSYPPRGKDGWPLDKSLALVPELYRVALAYGINPLTGQPSPAGRWRVRNTVRWCRPNPPVGALGDKFRPATTDMVIACMSRDRWFDLDAVRTPHQDHPRQRSGRIDNLATANRAETRADAGQDYYSIGNPAGAPPLDHWIIPTQPFRGAHYATWPEALCIRPILAMCPRQVCTICGQPSRRIVEPTQWPTRTSDPIINDGGSGSHGDRVAAPQTLGWSDCGHGSYRCRSCHVLVPSDYAVRRPSQAARSQAEISSEAVLVESLEGTGRQEEAPSGVRGMRDRLPGEDAGWTGVQSELLGEAGPPRGPDAYDPTEEPRSDSSEDDQRVCAAVGSGGYAGPAEEWLDDGAPVGHAEPPRPGSAAVGDRPSSQRGEGRQPNRESRTGDPSTARRDGDLPPLSGDLPGQLTGGYICPCGSTDIEYVADHWRPGHILDPFAGSGTTLAAAVAHGRHATGIDLDLRNADLARQRCGMFLTIEETIP